MSEADAPGGNDVDVAMEIGDGRTLVTVRGTQRAAVIVESESGERIYLPPEEFDDEGQGPGQSPYESPYDGVAETPYDSAADASPYESAGDESPYESGVRREQPVGVQATADGFRLLHPEPATDVRLLR